MFVNCRVNSTCIITAAELDDKERQRLEAKYGEFAYTQPAGSRSLNETSHSPKETTK